jgi:hypothetical protein
MTTVKHKYKLPSKHIKEYFLIIAVGGILGVVFNYVLHWTDTNGMYTTFGFFAGLAVLQFVLGVLRRSNTALTAELEEKGWKIHVWMKKELPAWKKMLSKNSNGMSLLDIDTAHTKVINQSKTLIFRNKATNGWVHVPSRIAQTPEFRAFMTSFMDSEDSKYLEKDTRKIIINFMDEVNA